MITIGMRLPGKPTNKAKPGFIPNTKTPKGIAMSSSAVADSRKTAMIEARLIDKKDQPESDCLGHVE
jgi:hypothetical protein